MAGAEKFAKGSAQEHLMYITEKVNPILEALVTAVLLERPEDPSFFMLKWLCEQTKSLEGGNSQSTTAEEIETIRTELNRLKERKAQLLALKHGGPVEASTGSKDKASEGQDNKSSKSTKADDDDEEEEEEEDDDDAPDFMPEPPKMNRGQRQSVSAEAYGDWNKKGEFKAPVYDKDDGTITRIRACLPESFLFSALEEEEMKTVILALKERKLEANSRIINAGDDGDSMFIIEDGTVDCLKKIDGEEKVVKKCSSGDCFGELALLYNCPRAASVQSVDKPCTLWELDRETFNRIVKDAAAKKRTTYTEFLKKIPLLGNMDEYEMMTIADALKIESFEGQGSQIIKQGDIGDKFFMVLEGEVVAKKAFTVGSEPRQVMVHKAGDYFGELAIINNEPRAASIFTSTDKVRVLSMDRKTFKRLLGPIEDILRREASRYSMSE
jgi:cAMP-dependent protein kinase regulator